MEGKSCPTSKPRSNTQTSDLKSYIYKQHKTDIIAEGEGGMNLTVDI